MLIAEKETLFNSLQSIEKTLAFITDKSINIMNEQPKQLFDNILLAVQAINTSLFNSTVLKCYNVPDIDFSVPSSLTVFTEACHAWITFIKDIIEKRYAQSTALDERFLQLLDYITYVDYDTILKNSKEMLYELEAGTIDALNRHYHTWEAFWGLLDTHKDCYDVLENRIHNLIEHRDDFEWLYNRLGDYRSKLVLNNMLYYWLSFQPELIVQMKEGNYSDYYDLDLLKCDENEVVVDLGAYTGDSAIDYISTYKKYKRIYCYEITPKTVEELKENMKNYPNVEIRNKGAGAKNCVMYLSSSEMSSSNTVSTENATSEFPVEIVSIDNDISEPVTLIKMDIEGSEQNALQGCRRHILEEHPKLLICIYHNNEDIYKIPRMITDMRDNYKLYLRSNGLSLGPSEIVLFAL